MPNLSDIKTKVIELLRKATLLTIILIFLYILLKVSAPVRNIFFPDPSTRPQASYGKLPAISFPLNAKETNFTYNIDTLTGLLPNLQSLAKVYKVTSFEPNLLSLQRTQEKVAKLGFTRNGTAVSNGYYQWTQDQPAQSIIINIYNSDFTFSTPYISSQKLQYFNNSQEIQDTVETARSFLSNMSLFPNDIDEQYSKISMFSIVNNSLTTSNSISSTNIVKVDFYQKNIDNLPIYYENGSQTSINILVGKEQNRLRVLEANYSHRVISPNYSTYSIKSAHDAFIDLKQGNAYIAKIPPNKNEISIKNVNLGYYVDKKSNFLMPIIVFQAEDFLSFVSGVKDEWVSN